VSVSRGKGVQVRYSADPGQDVVFAYQLHVIAHRGWRKEKVDVSVYKAKAAFLNEDGKVGGGEEVEVVAVTGVEDIKAFDDEMSVAVFSVKDGGHECVCLSIEDE